MCGVLCSAFLLLRPKPKHYVLGHFRNRHARTDTKSPEPHQHMMGNKVKNTRLKRKGLEMEKNGRPVSHTSASGGDSQTLATGVSVCHCLSEGTGGGVPRESPRVCLAWHSKGLCNYKTNKVGACRNREVGPWGGTPRA